MKYKVLSRYYLSMMWLSIRARVALVYICLRIRCSSDNPLRRKVYLFWADVYWHYAIKMTALQRNWTR